jgi:hypothetical protein
LRFGPLRRRNKNEEACGEDRRRSAHAAGLLHDESPYEFALAASA